MQYAQCSDSAKMQAVPGATKDIIAGDGGEGTSEECKNWNTLHFFLFFFFFEKS